MINLAQALVDAAIGLYDAGVVFAVVFTAQAALNGPVQRQLVEAHGQVDEEQ
jgi:hypothetical protein